jgi:nicotinic acid mononucleotide adenylyltransferase
VSQDFVRVFPTHQPWQKDGPTVSFSEVFTWLECAFKHKLAYVDRLSVFEESVHTVFGTLAHLVSESFMLMRIRQRGPL